MKNYTSGNDLPILLRRFCTNLINYLVFILYVKFVLYLTGKKVLPKIKKLDARRDGRLGERAQSWTAETSC